MELSLEQKDRAKQKLSEALNKYDTQKKTIDNDLQSFKTRIE